MSCRNRVSDPTHDRTFVSATPARRHSPKTTTITEFKMTRTTRKSPPLAATRRNSQRRRAPPPPDAVAAPPCADVNFITHDHRKERAVGIEEQVESSISPTIKAANSEAIGSVLCETSVKQYKKVKVDTDDYEESPLILDDLRHKTSGADESRTALMNFIKLETVEYKESQSRSYAKCYNDCKLAVSIIQDTDLIGIPDLESHVAQDPALNFNP
ncbi:hypothetical protein L1987_52272 [Smallanthus sonchifolius]|uniref:Uncharacterized protein n=1 Tax=Smallanthus sonchifolius TaxID=185202 RepID=A0ACB9ESR1_9ASTR|nr:hypothetical protein L1987_52272 [Smallanthus sonchifolius]